MHEDAPTRPYPLRTPVCMTLYVMFMHYNDSSLTVRRDIWFSRSKGNMTLVLEQFRSDLLGMRAAQRTETTDSAASRVSAFSLQSDYLCLGWILYFRR